MVYLWQDRLGNFGLHAFDHLYRAGSFQLLLSSHSKSWLLFAIIKPVETFASFPLMILRSIKGIKTGNMRCLPFIEEE